MEPAACASITKICRHVSAVPHGRLPPAPRCSGGLLPRLGIPRLCLADRLGGHRRGTPSRLLRSVVTPALSGAWLSLSSGKAAAAVRSQSHAAGPAVCGAAADAAHRGGARLGGAGVLALRAHRQGRQRPLPGKGLAAGVWLRHVVDHLNSCVLICVNTCAGPPVHVALKQHYADSINHYMLIVHQWQVQSSLIACMLCGRNVGGWNSAGCFCSTRLTRCIQVTVRNHAALSTAHAPSSLPGSGAASALRSASGGPSACAA